MGGGEGKSRAIKENKLTTQKSSDMGIKLEVRPNGLVISGGTFAASLNQTSLTKASRNLQGLLPSNNTGLYKITNPTSCV